MEQTMVPQIDATNPSSNPDAAAMSLPEGSIMDQLRAVAREQGVTVDANGNVAAPAQSAPVPAAQAPAQVQPTPAAPNQTAEQPAEPIVEVPQKFQNADGTPNVEKIAKSTANIDEMIERYKAKEREAQQLQNRVNNPLPTAVPAVPPPATQSAALQPLEIQVANDILSETQNLINQGYQVQQAQAIATARVQVRLQEARYGAEMSATAELRQRVEDQQRTVELKGMIENDPGLLSAEMADTLWKVRQENPWLNKAPEPWKAALHYYRGTQGTAQRVMTPTPTGTTAKAPPTPVGPVARVQPTVPSNPHQMTNDQLVSEIKKIWPTFRGK